MEGGGTFMHAWLERHVAFLEGSELGRRARERRNNIKSFYYVLYVSPPHSPSAPSSRQSTAQEGLRDRSTEGFSATD